MGDFSSTSNNNVRKISYVISAISDVLATAEMLMNKQLYPNSHLRVYRTMARG
jgi:hypothetical protein